MSKVDLLYSKRCRIEVGMDRQYQLEGISNVVDRLTAVKDKKELPTIKINQNLGSSWTKWIIPEMCLARIEVQALTEEIYNKIIEIFTHPSFALHCQRCDLILRIRNFENKNIPTWLTGIIRALTNGKHITSISFRIDIMDFSWLRFFFCFFFFFFF